MLATILIVSLYFQPAKPMDITPKMPKGVIAVPIYAVEPDRNCTSAEKALCKQDCMDRHEQYTSCEVKTVEGRLSRLCYCIDPALRAALTCEVDES